MFKPADLLATQVAPTAVPSVLGSRGFSFHAYFGLLPPRTVDMLTVRHGQLTVEGLPPSKIRSLAGCSPNAVNQPPTQEVGCICLVKWSY